MGYPGLKGEKGDMGPSGSPVSDSAEHITHYITWRPWASLTTAGAHICNYPEERPWFFHQPSYYLIRDPPTSKRDQEQHWGSLFNWCGRKAASASDDRLFFFYLLLCDITSSLPELLLMEDRLDLTALWIINSTTSKLLHWKTLERTYS